MFFLFYRFEGHVWERKVQQCISVWRLRTDSNCQHSLHWPQWQDSSLPRSDVQADKLYRNSVSPSNVSEFSKLNKRWIMSKLVHLTAMPYTYITHTTVQTFGVSKMIFCSPSLHLFAKKYSKNCNIVKYYYNFKKQFCIVLYFKM